MGTEFTEFKRTHVSINPDEIQKLKEMERFRKDLVGSSVSKKVHIIIQEWLRDTLNSVPKKKKSVEPIM